MHIFLQPLRVYHKAPFFAQPKILKPLFVKFQTAITKLAPTSGEILDGTCLSSKFFANCYYIHMIFETNFSPVGAPPRRQFRKLLEISNARNSTFEIQFY